MTVCVNLTPPDSSDVGEEPSSSDLFGTVISQMLTPAVCVFGVVGNLLNLAILTRRKLQKSFRTLEQAANLCLISLAVSDLMFCVFAFLTMFLPADNMFDGYGILLAYRVYCVAIINVFIMESTMLTVAMSLERYLAICFPLRQDIYLTTRRIKYIIVFTFIFSVCFNIPVLWRYEVVLVCPDLSNDVLTNVNMTSTNVTSMVDDASSYVGSNGHLVKGVALSVLNATTIAANAITTDSTGLISHSNNVMDIHNTSSPLSSPSLSSGHAVSSSMSSTLQRSSLHAPASSLPPSLSSLRSSTASPATNHYPRTNGGDRYTVNMVLLGGKPVYDISYRIVWAVVGNIIPLILLFYFNVCLCRKIYRSYKLRKQLGRQNQPRSSSHILTITLVAIVVLFFILVAPSEIALQVTHLSSSDDGPVYMNIEAVFNLMQSINFSVNFILYCIISPYFRRTLKYVLLCGCYNIYQVSRDWKKEFETSLM